MQVLLTTKGDLMKDFLGSVQKWETLGLVAAGIAVAGFTGNYLIVFAFWLGLAIVGRLGRIARAIESRSESS